MASRSRKKLQVGFALLLIVAGVVGLVVNSGVLRPVGRDLGGFFREVGRDFREIGHDVSEVSRDVGKHMGKIGHDIGQTAGEFGRELNKGAGEFAQSTHQFFASVGQGIAGLFRMVLRLWPLALIVIGAFLVFKPKSPPPSQHVDFTSN